MKTALLLFCLLASPLANLCQTSKSALFLGNSYTFVNDLPGMIDNVVTSKGNQFSYQSSTPGGYSWRGHTGNATSLNLLQAGNYDVLILQEQSTQLARDESGLANRSHRSFPYADFLHHFSEVNDSCNNTVLYQTWGRKPGNSLYTNGLFGFNYTEMQNHLTENYQQVADALGAQIAPVGEAWRKALNDLPQIELYSVDGSHPSVAGTYLAACVFYTALYKEPVAGAWSPASLSSADAQSLQAIADDVVVGNWSDWNIPINRAPCASGGLATNKHHWEPIGPATQGDLGEIRMTSATHGWVKGVGPEVWQTNDAGDTWSLMTLPADHVKTFGDTLRKFDLAFVDANTGYYAIGGEEIDSTTMYYDFSIGNTADFDSYPRVFKTTDGGNSWQETSPPRNDHQIEFTAGTIGLSDRDAFTNINLHFDDALIGSMMCTYGYNNDTVTYTFATDDGGQSWTAEQDTFIQTGLNLWFKNAEEAYKSGRQVSNHLNSDPQRLYKTEDRGATWTEIASITHACCSTSWISYPHEFSAMATTSNDTAWAVHSLWHPTLYRTTTNGQTWDSIGTIPAIGEVVGIIQPQPTTLVAISEGPVGKVWVSRDGGVSWKLDSWYAHPLKAIGHSDAYLYVTGTRGRVYRKPVSYLNSTRNPISQSSEFVVFPNPSTGLTQLSGGPANTNVQVLNAVGALVATTVTDAAGQAQLDLSHLPGGLFLIRVATPAGPSTRKLVLRP